MKQPIKTADALQTSSLREMVDVINSYGITKEDIVTVFQNEEGYYLLYYK